MTIYDRLDFRVGGGCREGGNVKLFNSSIWIFGFKFLPMTLIISLIFTGGRNSIKIKL